MTVCHREAALFRGARLASIPDKHKTVTRRSDSPSKPMTPSVQWGISAQTSAEAIARFERMPPQSMNMQLFAMVGSSNADVVAEQDRTRQQGAQPSLLRKVVQQIQEQKPQTPIIQCFPLSSTSSRCRTRDISVEVQNLFSA
tara:strand:- start:4638 stop:5063 length:426 start_codon:yes stop_codon:yes gene_type:complete